MSDSLHEAITRALNIIGNEWGYSAEQALDWLTSDRHHDECYDPASSKVAREWIDSLADEGGEA